MGARPAERFKFIMAGFTLTAHKAERPGAAGGFGFVMGIRLDGDSAWQVKTEQAPNPDGSDDEGIGEVMMSIIAPPPWPVK